MEHAMVVPSCRCLLDQGFRSFSCQTSQFYETVITGLQVIFEVITYYTKNNGAWKGKISLIVELKIENGEWKDRAQGVKGSRSQGYKMGYQEQRRKGTAAQRKKGQRTKC
jgi:hypothetical protein